MENRIPPYYENFDETHCFQCGLRGALEYFNPQKMWTWEELEELSGKKPGMGTWMFKTAADLPGLGYEVVLITDIDLIRLADEKEKYIIEFFGKEGAEFSLQYSDMEFEEANIRKAIANKSSFTFKHRSFTADDIRELLQQGFMVMPTFSSDVLYGNSGPIDHSVLIYAQDGDEVIFHENGGFTDNQYPIGPSKRLPIYQFVKAASANGKMEGLIAIRPKSDNPITR